MQSANGPPNGNKRQNQRVFHGICSKPATAALAGGCCRRGEGSVTDVCDRREPDLLASPDVATKTSTKSPASPASNSDLGERQVAASGGRQSPDPFDSSQTSDFEQEMDRPVRTQRSQNALAGIRSHSDRRPSDCNRNFAVPTGTRQSGQPSDRQTPGYVVAPASAPGCSSFNPTGTVAQSATHASRSEPASPAVPILPMLRVCAQVRTGAEVGIVVSQLKMMSLQVHHGEH